jgi:acetolactate synthase regulatory subunit
MGFFDKLKGVGASKLNEARESMLNDVEVSMLKEAGASMLKDAVASMLSSETKEQLVVKQSTSMGLYDSQMEKLIDLALVDGELTEKKKQILFKRAEEKGIDLDEFEMVLDAKIFELQNSNKRLISNKETDILSSIPKEEKKEMIDDFTKEMFEDLF